MRKALYAFAIVLACVAMTQGALKAQCTLRTGARVVLYGTSDDPDVFVWDSRFRMRSYARGSFDQARALLPHALLVEPGTRARIVSCVAGFVESKYSDRADDAIGIVIVSGRYRGRGGWVLETDVRSMLRRLTR